MLLASAAMWHLWMKPIKILSLIYDGQCAFCIRVSKIVRALDVLGKLRFYDATDRDGVAAQFPMLAGADLDDAMYAVTEDGRIHRGFFAFRRWVWTSPFTWPLVPLFYLPGSGFIGTRTYGWIAKNRRNFGCSANISVPLSRTGRERPPDDQHSDST